MVVTTYTYTQNHTHIHILTLEYSCRVAAMTLGDILRM